jgi:DeoR/GlpR family transcriptional regulator of sugar metabolism
VLDAGSTPLAMARALTVRPLTIITCSLDIAALFTDDPEVTIALTGGTWQRGNRALWGPAAIAMLAQCRADWAVPGACALHATLGVSASDEADAAMKRAMVACAGRTLVLADHSKLGNVAPFHVADWGQVHLLLLDEPWPDGAAAGVPLRAVDQGSS